MHRRYQMTLKDVRHLHQVVVYLHTNGGVKQGCVTAPTLLGIFFSLLLRYAIHKSKDVFTPEATATYSTYRVTEQKTKMHRVIIREMLFADYAALATRSEEALQRVISCFADTCRAYSPSLSA
ncbi:hypothetical protein ElyMa_004112600 [Elysia marginata]|uniref:Reverse transcriptase domain-containing protein n=1 Tax=Elysia marginata TaxID=1093978 RepID=A0AAV4GC31_9GAST|nr:hypothetical protein ElyMa_004112600 [Elysia marginata]